MGDGMTPQELFDYLNEHADMRVVLRTSEHNLEIKVELLLFNPATARMEVVAQDTDWITKEDLR